MTCELKIKWLISISNRALGMIISWPQHWLLSGVNPVLQRHHLRPRKHCRALASVNRRIPSSVTWPPSCGRRVPSSARKLRVIERGERLQPVPRCATGTMRRLLLFNSEAQRGVLRLAPFCNGCECLRGIHHPCLPTHRHDLSQPSFARIDGLRLHALFASHYHSQMSV